MMDEQQTPGQHDETIYTLRQEVPDRPRAQLPSFSHLWIRAIRGSRVPCVAQRTWIQTRARRPRGRHNRQSYARIVHPGHATLWRWFTFCKGKSNGRDGVWGERAESRGPSQPRHDRELRDTAEASRPADSQTRMQKKSEMALEKAGKGLRVVVEPGPWTRDQTSGKK